MKVSSTKRQWFLLSVRILLGVVFILAAAGKLTAGDEFLGSPAAFSILPRALVTFALSTLPWLEIGLGLLLLTGWCRRATVSLAILVTLVFIGANSWSLATGNEGYSGCFGAMLAIDQWQCLMLDLAMLGAGIAQLLRAAPSLSNPFHIPRNHLTRAVVSLAVIISLMLGTLAPALPGSWQPPAVAAADPAPGGPRKAPRNPKFDEQVLARQLEQAQAKKQRTLKVTDPQGRH
jgi:uncharacterized membrane protein YphA (DoxX/SURF4 family)